MYLPMKNLGLGWNLDGIRELAENFATDCVARTGASGPFRCLAGVARVDGLSSRPVAQMIWVILAV